MLGADDLQNILAGVSGSDTVFYAVGGGVLVVMAGIWGFNKVKALLSGRDDVGDGSFDWEPDQDDFNDWLQNASPEEVDALFRDSEVVDS